MPNKPDRLTGIDLNLLYTFKVFAECGRVQATAERLGRSQPAISARLHQLERELGTDLLVRQGRLLELTPFGRQVVTRLGGLFAGVQQLVDHARAVDDEPAGLLRVGALPTVGVFLLAPCIARLAREVAAAEVEVRYGLVAASLDGLDKGQLDVVVGVGDPPVSPDVDVTVVAETRPVLVLRRGAHELPRERIRPRDLARLAWVGFGSIGDAFFDEVWRFLERHRLVDRVRVRAAHIQTLKALVAAGAGVSVLPDYTVVEPELEVRRVVGLQLSQPIWIAARASSRDIPIVARFVDAVARAGS